MDPKSKKVLAQQGSSVAQAFKWIGGAIFGDPDDVLDDMASRAEEEEEKARPRNTPPRRPPGAPRRRRAKPLPPPEEDFIDVEGFIEDEDDE